MSYSIFGYKFNTNSPLALNKLMSDLRLKGKKITKEKKQKYLLKLILNNITKSKENVSDILYFMNSNVDFNFFEDLEEVNEIKSISDLINVHYKYITPEKLCLFINEDYDFMLINNTLDKAYDLLSEEHPLLDQFSFSTYSGEDHNTKDLEPADILYKKELRKLKKYIELSDEDFEDIYDDEELWDLSPTRKSYNLTKKTWEDFIGNNFYINEDSIRVVILDENSDYLNNGLDNFGYNDEMKLNDLLKDLSNSSSYKKIAFRNYISHTIEKMGEIKFERPSDYMRLETEIRESIDFSKNALEYMSDITEEFLRKNGEIKIKEYINIELY